MKNVGKYFCWNHQHKSRKNSFKNWMIKARGFKGKTMRDKKKKKIRKGRIKFLQWDGIYFERKFVTKKLKGKKSLEK